MAKLGLIRDLALPECLWAGISPKILARYRARPGSEPAGDLRREIADGLVDLLIQVVHRIGVRAEQRVAADLVGEIQRVEEPCLVGHRQPGTACRASGGRGQLGGLRHRDPSLRIAGWHPALFCRTAVGAEIDLLLDRPDGTLWAIEVKRGLAAKPKRGFSIACEDLSPSRAFIVYPGEERYPVAAGVDALGVREMAGLLAPSSPQAPDKVSRSPP